MNFKIFTYSFLASAIWILISDYLTYVLAPQDLSIHIQNVKGIFFVLISSLLLSWYVQKEIKVLHPYLQSKFNTSVFFVSAAYSIGWILITDYLVLLLAGPSEHLMQTIKGLIYVFTWSLIVSWFSQKEILLSRTLFPLVKSSSLGLYTGMIVHEIRTPLTIMMTQVEQLKEESEVDKKIKSRLNKALHSLQKTTDFFFKLSRNEALDTLETKDDIHLQSLIQESVDLLAKMGHKILLTNQIDCDTHVKGSYGLLSHLFLNLFKNAAEYMNQIHLDQPQLHVSCQRTDSFLEIHIQNAGSPLTHKQQLDLFSPKSSKISSGGMGFGLLICQEIMNAHHGKIYYNSKYELPTFTLRFPK